MRRVRKWLLTLAVAIAVPVVIAAGALAWALCTQAGLRFVLDRGVAITDGRFGYAEASGTLAGTTTLSGLRYHDAEGTSLHISRATVALQPWALLRKRLHIRKLRVDGITLELAPARGSAEPGSFPLQPPLAIVLDDAQIRGITIDAGGRPMFAADSLAIAGAWSRRDLVIRRLTLRAPTGRADLDGTLSLARRQRGAGTATIDWAQAGIHYRGQLVARSDGRTATLHATLTAPAALVVDATLQLDRTRAWTLAIEAPHVDARSVPVLPDWLRSLALALHATGDARSGEARGTLTVNGHAVAIDPARFRFAGKRVTIEALDLHSPSHAGSASVHGTLDLGAASPTAALAVAWRDVALPAALAGQALATNGALRLAGSVDRFTLKGTLGIGPPARPVTVTIDVAGTPQALRVDALRLVQPRGSLTAHGTVTLQPGIAWKLAVDADGFDPGAIAAGWDGAVDFTLATDGRLTPQGPVATLKLDGARGTLRGHNVAGSRADIRMTPGNLFDGSLLLVAGASRIQAQGTGGARTDATIELGVASLGDWLPDAAGRLGGRIVAKGRWPQLALVATLDGNGLRLADSHIDRLQLTAAIADVADPRGDVTLALAGVHARGFDFSEIRLSGGGTLFAHHLRLDATGQPLGLSLAAQGHWQVKARRWTGTLDALELSPRGVPALRQRQPTAITVQAGGMTLAETCLAAGTTRLCASGRRGARGALTARFDLQRLPLQLLASLAPDTGSLQATGEISGTGHFTRAANGALAGQASLVAGAGRIALAAGAGQPLLAWSSIGLDATLADSGQRLVLHGALADGGHIDGNAEVHGNSHALTGALTVDLRSLAFIGALSPEFANVQGSLAGNLRFGGTLSAPAFEGAIETREFSAELPRAGLKLRDGAVAISGDAQGRLAITGQFTSGQGVLHLDGSTGLAADAPLVLKLAGTDVLVADLPAARVVASPDLRISRSDGVYAVTGSVVIPSAAVKLDKLPGQGPAGASPDIVIVDAPPAAAVSPLALDADITMTLGDAVMVQGYGLDGSVQGQLAVRVRANQPATARGEIRIAGKYEAYGQNLTIERGRLLFAGTPLDNPGLDIRAARQIRSQDVTVGLSIRGTAQHPVLTIFSDPAMEQAEALSYLVTGRPLNALKSGEGDTLNTAAQALGGLAGDRIARSVGARLGLEAGVASSEALGGSAFTAGKYLSPRLFVSYGVGLFTPGQVITLRYTLNRFLQFEAENATTGTRASLNYRIEK